MDLIADYEVHQLKTNYPALFENIPSDAITITNGGFKLSKQGLQIFIKNMEGNNANQRR